MLRWLTLRIDRRLRARADRHPHAAGSRSARAGVAALLALVGRDGRRSTSRTGSTTSTGRSSAGNTPPGTADLRTRLTEVGNNGRLAIWRVALRGGGGRTRWQGGGAGTYRLAWERDRPAPPARVVDGHSLYYEVRAELGWIGDRACS